PAWSPELAAALQAHDAGLAQLTPALTAGEPPSEDDAPDTLRISNRVWPAVGVEPDQDYLDAVATAFDAAVEPLDYADPSGSALDRINDSVSQDTAGMIDPLLEALHPSTAMVLTNALHLEARWAKPFESTHDGAFTTPHGTVETPMMSGAGGTLQEHDGWQAVALPYRDGTLEAVAVLPPSGTEPCGLDAATLDRLDESPSQDVAVAMPRLEIERRHELLPPLEELGLDPLGDYGGLGTAAQISQVVQEVALRVDEDGTEAAAATAIGLEVSAPQYTEIDRPFLLLLRDTRTGSPLMVSVVNDPTA
ncbi:serpin family protein, partial [Actinotalea sp. C106]|uniref:serpin family protein n=1 Tax=Actinotalea sp. C106 TaxID=2908644 RepID=UPI002540817F